MSHVIELIARQTTEALAEAAAATTTAVAAEAAAPECVLANDYDGRIGLRVSALFVILIGSTLGACFPVFAARHRGMGIPDTVFFITKYFGSGVIIATAFIHLLAPANEALTNECLTGPITAYSWVEGIALITIFILFFIELMAMRYATFGRSAVPVAGAVSGKDTYSDDEQAGTVSTHPNHVPGDDHLSHAREHVDNPTNGDAPEKSTSGDVEHRGLHDVEDYSAQLTAIVILEFGVIFHSIFIGLTLAVAGAEFITLYIVLVFHQTFEGLGLGSRLATTPWPKKHSFTPYLFAIGYGLSTPIAIAIGLGIRSKYAPGSQNALIINGVFDSISAGILIYTGLVELMAHEFMFSSSMRRAPIKTVMFAFGVMCLGAGLMALLGKWA